MSVVVWRDGVLAGDTMGVSMDMKLYDFHKIWMVEGYDEEVAFGGVGDPTAFKRIALWYLNGQIPDEWPNAVGEESALLVVNASQGRVLTFCHTHVPTMDRPLSEPSALGSGMLIAVGALEAGASAQEAVQACIRRALYCGGFVEGIKLVRGRFKAMKRMNPHPIQMGDM